MPDFVPYKSPRIDLTKFRKRFRPEEPLELTAGELHPFILFLEADGAVLAAQWQEAVDLLYSEFGIVTGDERRQLDLIKEEIDQYRARVDWYLVEVNELIAEGAGNDATLAQRVTLPLFMGLYGKTSKLPDGSPLCDPFESDECQERLPDYITAPRLRNMLAAWVDFEEGEWIAFVGAWQSSAGDLVEAVTGLEPEELWEKTKAAVRAATSVGTSALKWGVVGLASLAGIYALSKL